MNEFQMFISMVSRSSPEQREAIEKIVKSHGRNPVVLDFHQDRDSLVEKGIFSEIVYGNVRPNEIGVLKDLKWIHASWTGIESLLYPEIKSEKILLTCTKGQCSRQLAEHAFAAIFYLSRDFPGHQSGQRREIWRPVLNPGLVCDSTVLIAGTGTIGKPLIPMLKAVGARVWGMNSSGRMEKGLDKAFDMDRLKDFLPEVDFLVLSLPSTPKTHKLVNKHILESLKTGAGIINVGRGDCIDEPSLINAIDKGKISGAVLDVTDPEPPVKGSILYHHPKVLLTNHRGCMPFTRAGQVAMNVFKKNLELYLKGEAKRMENLVQPDSGY